MVLFTTLTDFLQEISNISLTLMDRLNPPTVEQIESLGRAIGSLTTIKMLGDCQYIGLPDQEEETKAAEHKTGELLNTITKYIYGSRGPQDQ